MTITEGFLLPDPEIEEDFEQYKLDPRMPESLERPDLLAFELWQVKWHGGKTVAYIDVGGESPEAINHLSPVRFTVIEGVGTIATKTSLWKFNVETDDSKIQSLTVPRAQPYKYKGRFSAFIELSYPPLQGFTTYNGEPLGKEEQRILRQAKREAWVGSLVEEIDQKYGITRSLLHVIQHSEVLESYKQTPLWDKAKTFSRAISSVG